MTWFTTLTGFNEQSPHQVRSNITIDGNKLRSNVNDKTFICGTLETPSLAELRHRVQTIEPKKSKITVHEIIANVQDLHLHRSNAGALFQVASQFNLLEMFSPETTPEHGVGIYEYDNTQGPACGIAAGAGTIYRNYFVNINGQIGQSATQQIDCLADLGWALMALTNSNDQLWEMQNGYALASNAGLIKIGKLLQSSSESEIDVLRRLLRIGIQWNTQVTLLNIPEQVVSQAYCSALPIAYSQHDLYLWTEFAQLVLEAAYEATMCAAILNAQTSGNNKVFLTLLGGGAFGNPLQWILKAMHRALYLYKDFALDVAIVSKHHANQHVQELVNKFVW